MDEVEDFLDGIADGTPDSPFSHRVANNLLPRVKKASAPIAALAEIANELPTLRADHDNAWQWGLVDHDGMPVVKCTKELALLLVQLINIAKQIAKANPPTP